MADKPTPLPPEGRVDVITSSDGLTSRQIPEGPIASDKSISIVPSSDPENSPPFPVSLTEPLGPLVDPDDALAIVFPDTELPLPIKVVDPSTPAQGMDVDTDGNAHVEVHGNDAGLVDRTLLMDTDGKPLVAIHNDNGEMGNSINPFGITIYDNQTGARAIVDQNGAIKFGEAIILSGDVLAGQALSDLLWGELSVNGGSTAGSAGEQTFNTGTTANGEITLQSKKRSRFMISQFNIAHFGIQLNSGMLTDPDTIVEWGCWDPIVFSSGSPVVNTSENGVFFRVQGNATTPVWSIVSIKNGTEAETLQGSWNGVSAASFNDSPDLSVYEIQYNAGTAIFFQGTNFIHRLAGLTSTYAANYNFPVALRIRNINSNTTDRGFGSRAAGTYRLGEERGEVISRVFTSDTLIKTGAGYVSNLYLSRTGSGGGSGLAILYDGLNASGTSIGRVDVGGDDLKGLNVNSTFSDGLFLEVSGSGTNSVTVGFE